MKQELQKTIKSIANDISNINSPYEWIEENILEIRKEDQLLTYTIGGPNIYINVKEKKVEGYWGSSSYITDCDTSIFDELFEFEELC